MEIASTAEPAGGGKGAVYYNYVIADSALVAYGVQHPAPALTAAQQQYPMLVQQCIANEEPLETVSQATLNVLLQEIDGQQQPEQQQEQQLEQQPEQLPPFCGVNGDDARTPSPIVNGEHVFIDEYVDEDDEEEEEEEEDDDDEDDDIADVTAECVDHKDGYESEQELTSLAWLSDPARHSAVNVLAAVGSNDQDDDRDDDNDANDIKPLLMLMAKDQAPQLPQLPSATKQRDATTTHTSSASTARPKGAKSAAAAAAAAAAASAAAGADTDDSLRQLNDTNVTQERFNKFMLQVQQSQTIYASNELAYRALATEKPPFNYAQIIAMAMMQCGRMTLKDICTWIRERFAYYRQLDNWNNSIRHNLSLHFCFTKIARNKAEKGKGGYWELSMNRTKGEKKRVRNRSKRALAAAAAAAAAAGTETPPAAKRPRRVAAMRTTGGVQQQRKGAKVLGKDGAYHATELAASEAAAVAAAAELAQQQQQQQQQQHHQQMCAVFDGTDFGQLQNVLLENEIFLGCEIPLSGDSIIIPYSNPNSSCLTATGGGTSLSLAIPTSTPTSPTSSLASSSASPASSTNAGPSNSSGGGSDATDDLTAATLIAHGLTHTLGPNVIVEAMPYGGTGIAGQSVFDQVGDIERQISRLVQMPEPELVEYDVYFDYTW